MTKIAKTTISVRIPRTVVDEIYASEPDDGGYRDEIVAAIERGPKTVTRLTRDEALTLHDYCDDTVQALDRQIDDPWMYCDDAREVALHVSRCERSQVAVRRLMGELERFKA